MYKALAAAALVALALFFLAGRGETYSIQEMAVLDRAPMGIYGHRGGLRATVISRQIPGPAPVYAMSGQGGAGFRAPVLSHLAEHEESGHGGFSLDGVIYQSVETFNPAGGVYYVSRDGGSTWASRLLSGLAGRMWGWSALVPTNKRAFMGYGYTNLSCEVYELVNGQWVHFMSGGTGMLSGVAALSDQPLGDAVLCFSDYNPYRVVIKRQATGETISLGDGWGHLYANYHRGFILFMSESGYVSRATMASPMDFRQVLFKSAGFIQAGTHPATGNTILLHSTGPSMVGHQVSGSTPEIEVSELTYDGVSLAERSIGKVPGGKWWLKTGVVFPGELASVDNNPQGELSAGAMFVFGTGASSAGETDQVEGRLYLVLP